MQYPINFDTSDNNNYQYLKQLEEQFADPQRKKDLILHIRDTYGIDFIDRDVLEGEERELYPR